MDESNSAPETELSQSAAALTGVPAAPGPAGPHVHRLDRLHVLYKHRKVVMAATLLGLILGVVQTYTTPTAYMSTTVVRAEPDSSQPTAAPAGVDPEPLMQTELSVIQSRDLKRRVVHKLRLDQNPSLGTLLGPSGLDGASAALRARMMRAIRATLGSSRASESAHAPAAGMEPVAPHNSEQAESPAEAQAIELVAANLHVRPEKTGHQFTITVSSGSAQLSASLANALASEYTSENPARRRQRIQDQLKSIADALVGLTAQIEADQQTLMQSTADATVVAKDVIARNVEAAEADLNRKQSARFAAEKRTREMASLRPENLLDLAQTYPDLLESTASSRQQIATLRSDRVNVIKQRAQPDSALVKAIDSQITRLQEDLQAEIRHQIDAAQREYANAVSDERTADRLLKAHQHLQIQNNRAAISLVALKQDVSANLARRAGVLTQQQALEMAANGTTTNTAVVEYAQPPQRPYKPAAARNILISLALGLAVGLMLAFGLDRLDDTIKTPEDVTRKLHIPFLGLVPSAHGDRPPVISGPVPHDFGEAYRALRTSLVFMSGAETTRIITVTSAQPLEGKTTTACNLALVLAFGGSRVLLIDADLRRPGVHKALEMVNTVGLSHLLSGQARVREAIQRTSDPNLCVITAGRTPANPSELLASERMKQLVANLKQGPFDWVVIDTPPVLAVNDPVVLIPLVDGVTFVLGSEMTRRGMAERAVQMLMTARPKVIGAVLNRVNFDRNKYYYSRYYGYRYRNYYETDAAGTTRATA